MTRFRMRTSRWRCSTCKIPRMSKTIESRMWHQVMGLAHHMILAYLRFIRDPGAAEEGAMPCRTRLRCTID